MTVMNSVRELPWTAVSLVREGLSVAAVTNYRNLEASTFPKVRSLTQGTTTNPLGFLPLWGGSM